MTLVVMAHLNHGTTVLQKGWADSHGSYNVAVAAEAVKVNKGERVYMLLEQLIVSTVLTDGQILLVILYMLSKQFILPEREFQNNFS